MNDMKGTQVLLLSFPLRCSTAKNDCKNSARKTLLLVAKAAIVIDRWTDQSQPEYFRSFKRWEMGSAAGACVADSVVMQFSVLQG